MIGGFGTVGFNAASGSAWQTGAKTDTESSHILVITTSVVQSGTGATGVGSNLTSGGSAHAHTLSDGNAPLKKPSDTVDATHGGMMPDRYYLKWYMRR
jgi:glycerol dehydrogenase-like iron-containing ADH family enzyme